MFAVQVCFLSGAYRAAEPTARRLPEWPPAPDRLYQALVAVADAAERPALTALEAAPEILHGTGAAMPGGKVYVPSAHKHVKAERRDPATYVADPVVFVWPSVDDDGTLARIVKRVDYLGRAKSPIEAAVVTELPPLPHRLAPSERGDQLIRVPYPGRLAELDAAFDAGRRPPLDFRVPYRDAASAPTSSLWGEWIALRLPRALPITRTNSRGPTTQPTRKPVMPYTLATPLTTTTWESSRSFFVKR